MPIWPPDGGCDSRPLLPPVAARRPTGENRFILPHSAAYCRELPPKLSWCSDRLWREGHRARTPGPQFGGAAFTLDRDVVEGNLSSALPYELLSATSSRPSGAYLSPRTPARMMTVYGRALFYVQASGSAAAPYLAPRVAGRRSPSHGHQRVPQPGAATRHSRGRSSRDAFALALLSSRSHRQRFVPLAASVARGVRHPSSVRSRPALTLLSHRSHKA